MAAHLITTPFVTPERVAEVLGVPKTRAARLIRLARETVAQHPAEGSVSPSATKNDKAKQRQTANG